MRLVSRLRRIMAMMIVLLGLLAGLGVASAQDDAPILDRQTPSVAEQSSATLSSSATGTPLSSPSPIQAATPLSPMGLNGVAACIGEGEERGVPVALLERVAEDCSATLGV